MNDCSRYARSMEPYIDGELDPDHVVDVERHVLECSFCTERVALARATRTSLRRAATPKAPEAFRLRLAAALETERLAEREATPVAPRVREPAEAVRAAAAPPPRGQLVPLPVALALSAAAGVVFALGVGKLRPEAGSLAAAPVQTTPVSLASNEASRGHGFESMVDELVSLHANPLPPETTNPDELPRFDPLVGVPVRRVAFQPLGASFNGARIHALRDRRAALLQYTVGAHRVTMYLFDPKGVPVESSALKPRNPRSALPVYLGKMRGYSVAAAEKSGVGYVMASDLDDAESEKLIVAAVQ